MAGRQVRGGHLVVHGRDPVEQALARGSLAALRERVCRAESLFWLGACATMACCHSHVHTCGNTHIEIGHADIAMSCM